MDVIPSHSLSPLAVYQSLVASSVVTNQPEAMVISSPPCSIQLRTPLFLSSSYPMSPPSPSADNNILPGPNVPSSGLPPPQYLLSQVLRLSTSNVVTSRELNFTMPQLDVKFQALALTLQETLEQRISSQFD